MNNAPNRSLKSPILPPEQLPPIQNKEDKESMGWVGRHVKWIKDTWAKGDGESRLGIGLLASIEVIAAIVIAIPGWIILGMGCYEFYQQSKPPPLSKKNILPHTEESSPFPPLPSPLRTFQPSSDLPTHQTIENKRVPQGDSSDLRSAQYDRAKHLLKNALNQPRVVILQPPQPAFVDSSINYQPKEDEIGALLTAEGAHRVYPIVNLNEQLPSPAPIIDNLPSTPQEELISYPFQELPINHSNPSYSIYDPLLQSNKVGAIVQSENASISNNPPDNQKIIEEDINVGLDSVDYLEVPSQNEINKSPGSADNVMELPEIEISQLPVVNIATPSENKTPESFNIPKAPSFPAPTLPVTENFQASSIKEESFGIPVKTSPRAQSKGSKNKRRKSKGKDKKTPSPTRQPELPPKSQKQSTKHSKEKKTSHPVSLPAPPLIPIPDSNLSKPIPSNIQNEAALIPSRKPDVTSVQLAKKQSPQNQELHLSAKQKKTSLPPKLEIETSRPENKPKPPLKEAKKQAPLFTVNKIARFVTGALLFGGAALGAIMLTRNLLRPNEPPDSPLSDRELEDQAFNLTMQVEGNRLNLQTLEDAASTTPNLYNSSWHLVTELNLINTNLANCVEKGEPGCVEEIAKKVAASSQSISAFGETVYQNVIPSPNFDVPLARLCGLTPSIPINSLMLAGILSDTFGGKASFESAAPLDAVNYMIDRISFLGSNPEQISTAKSLHKSLTAFPEFTALQQSAALRLQDKVDEAQVAVDHALKKLEKIRIKAPIKEVAENAQQFQVNQAELEAKELVVFDEIKVILQELQKNKDVELGLIHQLLTEKIMSSSSRGFIIPSALDDGVLHIIPEFGIIQKSNTKPQSALNWTLRLYHRAPSDSGGASYHPYTENTGIPTQTLLSTEFINSLAGFSIPFERSNLPQDILDMIPKGATQGPFINLQQNSITPLRYQLIKPALEHPVQLNANIQTALNDIIYVEMGPEAILDFQLSTINHYIAANKAELSSDPRIFTSLIRSISPLAHTIEMGARQGWINPNAVSEKGKVITDNLNAIQQAAIALRKNLRREAPSLVDEGQGTRKIAQGEIPKEPSHNPLTGTAQNLAAKPFTNLLQLTPNVNIAEFSSVNPLEASAVTDLANKLKIISQQDKALIEFHSWSNSMLGDASSTEKYTPEEINKVINNLVDISSTLTKNIASETSKEKISSIALALTEAITIGDLLMQKSLAPNLQGKHLPIPLLINQLANQGLFGKLILSPSLVDRSSALKLENINEPYLFAEGVVEPYQSEEYWFPARTIWTDANYRKTGYFSKSDCKTPWTYFKFYLENANVHDTYLKLKSEGKEIPVDLKEAWNALNNICAVHREIIKPGIILQMRDVIKNTAIFTTAVLTSNVQEVNAKLKNIIESNPQRVVDAVSTWTQYLNPSSIAVTTLEMLSEEQRNSLLTNVGEIAQHYFAALFLRGASLPSPETMLSFIELLTFADQVMAYSTDSDKTRYQLPLESFREIVDGKNPFFRTFDPHVDGVRFAGIKRWMNERALLLPSYDTKFPRAKPFNELGTSDSDFDLDSYPPYNPLFTDFRSFFSEPYATSNEVVKASINFDLGYVYLLSKSSSASPTNIHSFRNDALTSKTTTGFNTPFYSRNVLEEALRGYADPNHGFNQYGNGIYTPLPPWFFAIRNLAFFTQHTLHSGFINPMGDKATANSFVPKIKILSNDYSSISLYNLPDDHYKIAFEQTLLGVGVKDLANFPEVPDGQQKETHFSHLEPHIDDGFSKDVRKAWTSQSPLINTESSFVSSLVSFTQSEIVENVMKFTHRPSPYNLNTIMETDVEPLRRELSTNDYITRMALRGEPILQTFLTLSEYLDNPAWLSKPNDQIEFLSLLFTPGFLNEHLKTPEGVGPAAEKDLYTFIRNQIKVHGENKQLVLFLTEVAVRLQGYSFIARQQAPEVYKDHPVSAEYEELFSLPGTMLARTDLTAVDKSSYSALRALNFLIKDELTSIEVTQFTQAVLNYRSHASHLMVNEIHTQRQIDQLLQKFISSIEKALYPNGPNQPYSASFLNSLLDGIVDSSQLTKLSLTPASNNPFLFSDEKGALQINLLEGTVIESGKEGISLPSEVRLSTPYQMVFGSKNYRAQSIDRFTFQFPDENGFTNQFRKNKDNSWALYRQFEDPSKSFQFVTHEWRKYNAVTKSHQPIPWLDSKILLNQYSQWHWEGKSPEVRLLDHSGNLAYRIPLGGNEGKTIQGVYKVTSKEELQLADIKQSAYKWTSTFEDPAYTHVWLSNQKGRHIEFPRFDSDGISFTWSKRGWSYDREPQYHVVDPQTNPLFPGQNSFLHLKTKKKAERILIPRLTPSLSQEGALTFDLPFDRMTDNPNSRIKLLTIDKNPKTKLFEGTNPESNLYLAMLHLSHREYSRAHQLLNSLAGHAKRFTPEEMQLLDWMVSGSFLPPDETPQAIGIKTAAAYLKMQNIEKNLDKNSIQKKSEEGGKKVKEYEVPQQLKDSYLKVVSGIPGLRLSPSDEVQLFEDKLNMGNSSTPLHEVLLQMELVNPLAAREALDNALTQILFGEKEQLVQLNLTLADGLKDKVAAVSTTPLPPVISKDELAKVVSTQIIPTTAEIPQTLHWLFDFNADRFTSLPGPTQERLRELRKGVELYQASRDKNTYQITNPNAFTEMRVNIEAKRDALAKEMEFLKVQILSMANPRPKGQLEADKLKLQLAAGTITPITLDKLLGAYEANDLRKYIKLNPSLDLEAAKQLDTTLQKFLDRVPDLQHHQRLIDAMREVETLTLSNAKNNSEEFQQALKEFVSGTEMGRQFPPEAERLMKVMEYQTGKYYRPAQIESLAKMGLPKLPGSVLDKNTSAVHWITVGAGKTSYLLPSLCRYATEQGKLCLAIMPKAQLTSAGSEFSAIMKDVYGVSTQLIEFHREHNPLAKMEANLKQVTDAIEKGNPVLTSGASLRNLILEFKEHYNILVEMHVQNITGEKQQKQEILVETLQKLLNIFSAKPIIDEIHQEYAPRIETNYPSGEAQPLPIEYGIVTLNLYEIIRDDPEIQARMHFNFIPQHMVENSSPFIKEHFANEIAPLLVKKFLNHVLSSSSLDPELGPLQNFLKKHVQEQKNIESYLLKKREAGYQQITSWVESQESAIREQLALIRGQLNVLLPLTLNKNFGENYGYEKNSSDILPTPFAAADTPNKGSKNSSPFEQTDYLLQALFHEGARRPMIDRLISALRQQRLKELNEMASKGEEFPLGKRIDTPSDAEFRRLFPIESYTLDTPQLEEVLMAQIKDHPSQLRHLIRAYALPLVKVFPANSKATSQHLGNLFSSWEGFSGTPMNFPTYPGNFTPPEGGAVVGRMLSLIADHSFGKTHTIKVKDRKEILLKLPSDADAFMDAGAMFATEDLDLLASAWGNKVGKAYANVDKELGVIIKQHKEDKGNPLKSSSIVPQDRVSLYPQANIIGTDIPQKKNGVGIVSVSKSTTYTQLEQAAGRMRGIEQGQKIELLILEDDAVVMREKLGFSKDHSLTSEEVIFYTIIYGSEQDMDNNEVALRHKLHAVLDNYVFNFLKTSDIKKTVRTEGLQDLFKELFFPDVNISPFELFGRDDESMDRQEVFEKEIDKLLGIDAASAKNFAPLFERFFDKTVVDDLRIKMKELVSANIKNVNEKIKSQPQDIGLEQEQELLAEQEQETSVEQELESELLQENLQGPKPARRIKDHIDWKDISAMCTWDFWSNQNANLLGTTFDFFDDNLKLSTNYQYAPLFTAPQKPFQMIMIVKNKQTGDYRLIFLDPKDAKQFKLSYDNLALEQKENTDAEIWLGHIDGRKLAGNLFAGKLEEKNLDAKSKNLWWQAQLFAGRTTQYSPERYEGIKTRIDSWATKKATSEKSKEYWLKMAGDWLKKIMISKEDVVANFPRSSLGKIFADLRESEGGKGGKKFS